MVERLPGMVSGLILETRSPEVAQHASQRSVRRLLFRVMRLTCWQVVGNSGRNAYSSALGKYISSMREKRTGGCCEEILNAL